MANDPFVVVARLLEPYGVTADMLKHKLGHEFHLADYACHLKPGDEVAVNRTKLIRDTGGSIVGEEPLAHWQYGIYVGNGKVVDFGAENTTDAATIAQRSWGRFCGNLDEYTSIRTIRVDWPPNIVRSLKESARIALQIVEMQTTVRQATYNPHNFNCQHLATWCRIGLLEDPNSDQVRQIHELVAQQFGWDPKVAHAVVTSVSASGPCWQS